MLGAWEDEHTMVTLATIRKVTLPALLMLASTPARADDWDGLVAADKAFAADAQARGVREAFLAAMAPQSLMFAPGLVNGRAYWTDRPASTMKLQWAPEAAEIAASGDLGYTYGPFRVTPAGEDKATAFGHYLSVWQRTADAGWKLTITTATWHADQPLPEKTRRLGGLALASSTPGSATEASMAELRKADQLAPGHLAVEAVSGDFTRLRAGRLPDAEAAGAPVDSGQPRRLDTGALISQAGDLAVTWGGGDNSAHWLRIWRRATPNDAPGLAWRLAVDLCDAAPSPPETP